MTESVWSNLLADPGPAGDPSHDAGGAVAVESATGTVTEDRTRAAFADGEVDTRSDVPDSHCVTSAACRCRRRGRLRSPGRVGLLELRLPASGAGLA